MQHRFRSSKPERFAGALSALTSVALLGAASIFGTGALAQGPAPGAEVPGRYIVELRPGASPAAVARAHGASADLTFSTAVRGFAGAVPAGRLAALKRDPRVAAVTPDRVVTANPKPSNKPGDGGGGDSGDAPRAAEIIPAGVERIGAAPEDALGFQGSGVGVAVVDTGIDLAHPDLQTGSVSFKAVVKGWRISTSEGAGAGQDDNGHGTHVAGIVAAKADGFDVVGVAPGATVYAVKVLDSRGSGYDSTVIAGLDWIAANADTVTPNIRVANMSLGRSGSLGDNTTYRQAIQGLVSRGITVVTSAGNSCDAEVSGMIPAGYPEVISVASSTARAGESDISFTIAADVASYFTTDGAFDAADVGVTISAPGEDQENIQNGYITSVGILSTQLGGGTIRHSGTSMAAPHVAGVVALLVQQNPATTPDSARLKIMGGASRVGAAPLDSPTACYSFDLELEGILDARGALEFAPWDRLKD